MRHAWHLSTRSVHPKGERELGPSLTAPIYQTSVFALQSAKAGARMAAATHPERYYTRWGNPTTQVVEEAVAELEGGEAALATSSGMGAISMAVLACVRQGDHIVAGRTLYTATEELFTRILPSFGITHTLVDMADPASAAHAFRPSTKVVYIETPANPTLVLSDIAALAKLGRAHGAEVIVDNTFATPVNQRPLALGATVVIHSATKYLGGHHDLTGGLIVGSKAFLRRAWQFLKILGPTMSPFDSWLVIRGLKTLALRVARHNANAHALAAFLEGHRAVAQVHYPGLRSFPQHALARQQMRGFGGVLSFEVRGGFPAGRRFVERVRLARLAVSLGGVETLVQHPASMSHGPLTAAERKKSGINDALIRVSVGVEDVRDLKADFAQALDGVRPPRR
jgi:cystathionine beta-lyase/cystathionine gamma-synthase